MNPPTKAPKRLGRPPDSPEVGARKVQIPVYVAPVERDAILKAAMSTGLTASAYLREAGLLVARGEG